MANTIYMDQETKANLVQLAELRGRSIIEIVRRLLTNDLESLPALDFAVLHQVAKEEGLASPLQAASHIIQDWQRFKMATLRRPTPHHDGQEGDRPHVPAIRVPATVAQPEEA